MAKGPLITDTVEVLIATVYQKHPKWKAPAVHSEVSYILRKDDPKLPPNWPSLSTVQKTLAKIRKPHLDPQDKPWCLASLSKYPLPLEAIPIILQVQHNVQSHRSPEVVAKPKAGQPVIGPFTIREAQWVARLKFIEDIVTLEHWAHAYTIAERVSDIIGRDFDSSEMDKAILRYIPPGQKKGGKSQ